MRVRAVTVLYAYITDAYPGCNHMCMYTDAQAEAASRAVQRCEMKLEATVVTEAATHVETETSRPCPSATSPSSVRSSAGPAASSLDQPRPIGRRFWLACHTLLVLFSTQVASARVFWPAEAYHQRYLQKGGQNADKECEVAVRCYG